MTTEDQITVQRQDLSPAQRTLLQKRLLHARQSVQQKTDLRPAIVAQTRHDNLPLSYAQESLWFVDQITPDRAAYNLYHAVRITGPVSATIIERCLNEIVHRHAVFRTTFTAGESGPVQHVAPYATFVLQTAEVASLAPGHRDEELARRLRAEAHRPFDLSRDLLLRGLLVRTGPNAHVLLLVMHHIVSDGWTLGLLFRELGALHGAFTSGAPSPLPGLPIQYADYAVWERETLKGDALHRPLAYWRNQLAGAPALELPTDRPRPADPQTAGATRKLSLSPTFAQDLRSLSHEAGTTLFMTLLAGFQGVLHRYTSQDDIVIGSCVAGRSQLELEKLAGFFVNTIVLRSRFHEEPSFRQLLAQTRDTVLGAMAHQDLPFEKLVAELQPDRSPTRNPFFQVMFVLQNAAGMQPHAPGLSFEPFELENGTSKFDLTFAITELATGGLDASMEYRSDLFDGATIERLLGHFQQLLSTALAQPDRPIRELTLLSDSERAQILSEWNGTRTSYPRDRSISGLFAEHAARTPAAIALISESRSLTYLELDQQSNRLARRLQRAGVRPGDLVAVCLDRGPDLITSLLAILKSGGAYVSLDPAYPAERLGFMMADTEAPLVITDEQHRTTAAAACPASPQGAPAQVLCLDSEREAIQAEEPICRVLPEDPESLAYVSYTSGSTGRPKGVCVTQRGVVRLVRDTDYAEFGPTERFLQFAPVAFDASTLEIWGPLLNGGSLAIVPAGLPTLAELANFIREKGVTSAWLTSGLFNQMIEEQAAGLRGLRQLFAGGDVLSTSHVCRALQALPGTRLINGYGPTENTTFTTCHLISQPPAPGYSVPIGRPIANTEVYVLDASRQLVPVGIPGELYTGGDGLAKGYLRQPELDRARFVPHPFSPDPEARLYRTGDKVRWRSDGTLEFLGRMDRQVKIRGFRIEPDEIESALEQHPTVRQAIVIPSGEAGESRRLIAYLVGHDGKSRPEAAELRRYLRGRLPDHFIPASFVALARFPLNAHGKIDRSALPAPAVVTTSEQPGAELRDPAEIRLATLWQQVLGVPRVGAHDNFFELGGHSMAGVRLFAGIEREFGRRLPLACLFEAPTVEQLARRIQSSAVSPAACSSLVAMQPSGTRPPIFFVHGAGGGNLWTYANLVPHLGSDQPIFALESRAMRGRKEFECIEDMASHYIAEIRSVQARGPYYLGGYCFGGNVAYEMARQLTEGGDTVAMVALLDSAPANSGYQRIPWWRPDFHVRFALNTAYWLGDFASLPMAEQLGFIRRKSRIASRKIARQLTQRARGGARAIDVEEVIDISLFPEIEIDLWKTHLQAICRYHPKPYRGRLTLFRTRGQPFLCSFDPLFGWGSLAGDGVESVRVPGSHERIFMEPYVRTLCIELRQRLDRAHALHS